MHRLHLPILLLLFTILALAAAPSAAGQEEGEPLCTAIARIAKVGSCGSLAFSPDGSWLAFVSNSTGVPQVWAVDADGGWPRLLTALVDPVGDVASDSRPFNPVPDPRLVRFRAAGRCPPGGVPLQIWGLSFYCESDPPRRER